MIRSMSFRFASIVGSCLDLAREREIDVTATCSERRSVRDFEMN